MEIKNDGKYCRFCGCFRLPNKKWYHEWLVPVCECKIQILDIEEMDISQLSDEDYIILKDVDEKQVKVLTIKTLKEYINSMMIPQIEKIIREENKK